MKGLRGQIEEQVEVSIKAAESRRPYLVTNSHSPVTQDSLDYCLSLT